jgi:cell shape-determining protein MreD
MMPTRGSSSFDRRDLGERPVPVLRLVLLAATTIVLHSLLFTRLRIANVGPDLFLILSVVGGLELGVAGGAALGVLAGVAADMTTYLPIGLWALVGGVLGFVMGLIRERAFTGTLQRPPFLLAFLGVFVGAGLYPALALVVSDVSLPSPLRLIKTVVISALWAVVLVLPMRALVRFSMGTRG